MPQLEMMQQDYVTERRAREKAAKTMQEMRGEIDRLRRDNAEMREVLNSQAASHFSQEFAEVGKCPTLGHNSCLQ